MPPHLPANSRHWNVNSSPPPPPSSPYPNRIFTFRPPRLVPFFQLPVHCAAAGGNLNILAWLVDDRCCPLFLDRAKKVRCGACTGQRPCGVVVADRVLLDNKQVRWVRFCLGFSPFAWRPTVFVHLSVPAQEVMRSNGPRKAVEQVDPPAAMAALCSAKLRFAR